jgi:hypothetical protein
MATKKAKVNAKAPKKAGRKALTGNKAKASNAKFKANMERRAAASDESTSY